MNEQELADLFSEQLDRLLAGGSPDLPPNAGELQDLLNIVKPATSQTGFHAGSAAQAAFNNQLAGWFGLTTGGSPMTILGLSKVWFLSIVSTIVVVVGGSLIAVIATTAIIFGSGDDVPVAATDVTTTTPTSEETATAVPSDEPSATPEGTETAVSETPTPEASGTPMAGFPTLIIKNQLVVSSFCGGAYVSQSTLVNYGPAPVTNAALAWNVIEGADFVDQVSVNSDAFEQVSDDTAITQTGSPAVVVNNTSVVVQSGSSNFNQIAVDQDVDLNLAVGVNDAWWDQPDGTVIKVKLSAENASDHNRGHGNDPDGFDEDNPGRGGSKHKDKHGHDDGHSQIITIVKQGAQWVVLDGFLHDHGDQSFLVDGNVVVTNNCTGLPPTLPFGSRVKIIGKLLPDGTFLAINIIIIDVDINIDFDSGVQSGGGNGHGGGDNYGCCGGGGGGQKGGSKKGGS
jgi:hypothetical protein